MNLFFYILLVTTSPTLFSMTSVEKYKSYKITDGREVIITYKFSNLLEAIAKKEYLPNIEQGCIERYVHWCIVQSGNGKKSYKFFGKIIAGDQEAIQACIDPTYAGEFYLGIRHPRVRGINIPTFCITPSEVVKKISDENAFYEDLGM